MTEFLSLIYSNAFLTNIELGDDHIHIIYMFFIECLIYHPTQAKYNIHVLDVNTIM